MDTRDYTSNELTVSSVDSLNELQEILQGFKKSKLIGDSEEGINTFHHLNFIDFEGNIGLCSYSNGDCTGCRKFNDSVVIFNDQMLYLFNKNMEIEWKHRFEAPVYDTFIWNDHLVIVYEIGVTCFSSSGDLVWSHSMDLVVNHSLKGNVLTVTTDEGSSDISLKDGKIVGRHFLQIPST